MSDKTLENVLRIRAVDAEEIWRTIRGAKVMIDKGTGEIKGGAGGKMNGMKYRPGFARNLKTGKRVLLPGLHTKLSHFKGTKADLLKKLGKAVGKKPELVRKNVTYATVKNKFAAVKTREQLKSELLGQGYLGSVRLPQNVNTARLCATGVATVMDRYPVMKEFKLRLTCKQLGAGVLGSCSTDTDQRVAVSQYYYEDEARLKQAADRGRATKFHPAGVGEEAIVVHEYGHAINGIVNREMRKIDPNYFSPRHTFQGYVFFKVCGLNDSMSSGEIEKLVSGYAAKNHREFLAEALSEALCSPHPRPTALKVLAAVDDAMRKISEARKSKS